MTTQFLAGLGIVLALAGCTTGGQSAADGETTSTYRQGGSTATITQEGDGSSTTVRRTVTGPDGQTIVQQQGGNSIVIRQN